MKLNQYMTLGRSGLKVSPLCLGAMTFGEDWGWGSSEETARAIFDAYIDKGGNFIDTADGYTNGKSEELVGKFVKDKKRHEIHLLRAAWQSQRGRQRTQEHLSRFRRLAEAAWYRLHRHVLVARLGYVYSC
jgi:aryl-alcohol dehydrogenase-like predicted oxidoreductase